MHGGIRSRIFTRMELRKPPTLKSGEDKDLRLLKAWYCTSPNTDVILAARIVLREFLTTDNDSSALQEYQLGVIKNV